MFCAIVFARHATEIGCRETYYLGSSAGYACVFGLVCDRDYDEETDGAVEWDGLSKTLI